MANSTGPIHTVGWQADPGNGRGTFGLVSSCLLTLGICVYSAMHLNVPPPGEPAWQFWVSNVKWGALGVFGPELVIFLAWKQYLSAKNIVQISQSPRNALEPSRHEKHAEKHMATEYQQIIPSSSDSSATPWTLVHGFYAGMGGFTFPSNAIDQTHPRLTLTARGVALLAECELLPSTKRDDILDKSKSDGLSKFIACMQAAWFIVQVIGRLGTRVQVTLLEINTLGHVFCALIIYVLWWHKPRQVKEPTTLAGDWVGPLCAYMYMSSRISGSGISRTDLEMSSLAFFPERPCPLSCARARQCHNSAGSFGRTPTQMSHPEPSRKDIGDDSQEIGIERQLRWCLAAEAVRRYPAIKSRFNAIKHANLDGAQITYLQELEPEELLVQCSTNWSREGLLRGEFGLVMGMVLWSASMAFGGIHAAAWDGYFPSKIESRLWRISSVYISSSGLVWCIINMVAKLCKGFDDYWNRTVLPHPPFAQSYALVCCCAVCGAMYIFARLYLVIEAFISIRQLPVAAYETPNWTQLIPHL